MKTTSDSREMEAERIRAETRHEETARRAYELWEQAGCRDGGADADWYAAEQQLRGSASLLEISRVASP